MTISGESCFLKSQINGQPGPNTTLNRRGLARLAITSVYYRVETACMQLLTMYSTTIYFASAAVAVGLNSSHMTASSSASWSRFSPPSDFVNRHVGLSELVSRRKGSK